MREKDSRRTYWRERSVTVWRVRCEVRNKMHNFPSHGHFASSPFQHLAGKLVCKEKKVGKLTHIIFIMMCCDAGPVSKYSALIQKNPKNTAGVSLH